MALNKYSAFYYGHTILKNNRYLNFGESYLDPVERVGLVDIGGYTLTKFGELIAKAMNAAGSQEYTVTLDRAFSGRLTRCERWRNCSTASTG